MDEKDKKIKELEDKAKVLEAEKITLSKERDDFKKSNEDLGKDLKKKDAIIEQKTKDVIGARQQYKKMSERTKEELESLSDAEKEILQREELRDKELADLKKETADRNAKEVGARKAALIKKYAGTNADLAKKIEENLAKLDPAALSKAVTDEELQPHVDAAWNMLGNLKPDPIKTAMGGGNGAAPGADGNKDNFADTPEGQKFLSKLAPAAVTPPAK